MRHARAALTVLSFGVIAGPIAYGLLADAKAVRTRNLLAEMQAAEHDLAFTAVRTATSFDSGSPVTVVQRVYGAAPMRRKVEFIAVEGVPEEKRAKPTGFSPFMFLVHIQTALAGPGLTRPGSLTARFTDLGLVAKNYEIIAVGREAVAGREADVIDLIPRHPGRAGYRLWADRVNRFPLRFQVVRDGQTLFETSTRSITFERPDVKFPDGARREFIDIQREAVTEQDLEALKFHTFLPGELPAGFVRRELTAAHGKVPGMDETMWALSATYTDGVASLMILEFDANNRLWKQVQRWLAGLGDAPPAGEKGKIIAQRISSRGGCAIRMTMDGTEIIASGQVGPGDLERVVRGLKRTDGGK